MARIFISNLDLAMDRERLVSMFSEFGVVEEVDLNGTNGLRRSAYVTMPSLQAARNAADLLDGTRISNREVMVRVLRDM